MLFNGVKIINKNIYINVLINSYESLLHGMYMNFLLF